MGLQEACTQGAAWRHAGHAIGIAVNVSARQPDSDAIVTDVTDALASSGLEAAALTLAIDDFGTGYCSLAHLQRSPVDELKIDHSFIARLKNNPEGEALLHTPVQLGQALAIETLAEGIEQPQQLALLQHERCDSGQGFLYARPLDADATTIFLEQS